MWPSPVDCCSPSLPGSFGRVGLDHEVGLVGLVSGVLPGEGDPAPQCPVPLSLYSTRQPVGVPAARSTPSRWCAAPQRVRLRRSWGVR